MTMGMMRTVLASTAGVALLLLLTTFSDVELVNMMEKVQPACPPLSWVTADMGSSHWIINYTDPTSWGWYMDFLNVSHAAWPAEFHATDLHQYIFFTNDTGMFYIMNHTIPGSGFHLLYEADTNGNWVKNPYPVLTPAGFDPSSAKVSLAKVRYVFDAPGVPFADSCHAWRTDMPVVKNITQNGKVVPTEFIVTFWRELVSPTEMRCTLYVTEAASGHAIAPWSTPYNQYPSTPGYGLPPSSAIPGHPQRLSYRYFRKTVQSFPDAEKRYGCVKSGLPGDDHEFC